MPAQSNPAPKPTSRCLGLIKVLGALWFSSFAAVLACYGQNAAAAKPQAVSRDVLRDTSVGEVPVPAAPAAVLDIVEIQPFRLKAGYRFDWLQDRPLVNAGLLVVLRVDPKYVVPRDAA